MTRKEKDELLKQLDEEISMTKEERLERMRNNANSIVKMEAQFNGETREIEYLINPLENGGLKVFAMLFVDGEISQTMAKKCKNRKEFTEFNDEMFRYFLDPMCEEMDEFYFGKEEAND